MDREKKLKQLTLIQQQLEQGCYEDLLDACELIEDIEQLEKSLQE